LYFNFCSLIMHTQNQQNTFFFFFFFFVPWQIRSTKVLPNKRIQLLSGIGIFSILIGENHLFETFLSSKGILNCMGYAQ
jgi:hypothetical protein